MNKYLHGYKQLIWAEIIDRTTDFFDHGLISIILKEKRGEKMPEMFWFQPQI